MKPNTYILIFSSPDKIGIVSSITSFLSNFYCNIIEAKQFVDMESNHFFMRCEFVLDRNKISILKIKKDLKIIFDKFKIKAKFIEKKNKKKIAVLVSKKSHCLVDLLEKWKKNEIECDIKCIISNHDELKKISNFYRVPFVFLPIKNNDKVSHFKMIEKHLKENKIESLFLARYMQILPEFICKKYINNIINIHHGFLPSFIGAKPYHQAYSKGVKLIGATGHYVTQDLDAGPIIEQDVIRVSHQENVTDMIYLGQDIERSVFIRAIKLHLENRIIVFNNKTILLK